MNAIGICILTLLVFVVAFAPSRWAAIGMMAGVLYLTQGEAIDLLGLNMYAVRFLELAGFTRIIIRREFSFSKLNEIDRALLWLYGYTIVVFLLRSTEGQANQIGMALDAILCYFTFRGLIVNVEDLRWLLRVFALLLVPYVILVSIERLTGHNPFSLVGASPFDSFRNGMPRCRGSFRHSVLMGTLGASFLPLYIGLAFRETDRIRALFAAILCLGIVWFSNSGGPAGAVAFGLVGWLLWPARRRMKLVRRSLVGLLVLTALFMKAPIWFLMARVSEITGGDGYHRSLLIDRALRDLDKWWLAGMPITETKNWFPYSIHITGGADITNQFLYFGLLAGLGAIALLIFLLARAFQNLGNKSAAIRSALLKDRQDEYLLWGLGVMLSVHIVNWLGVRYFDQFYVIWFLQLACISSCSQNGA